MDTGCALDAVPAAAAPAAHEPSPASLKNVRRLKVTVLIYQKTF
jgi:hypothetical protein